MHPRAALCPRRGIALEGDDRPHRAGQHLAVVGDHHDRLARAAHAALELELRRHVEEVVGLVERQHVGVGGEQDVEHELLALPARERARRTVGELVEGGADDPPARDVPVPLELVAAERRPVGDRRSEPDPGPVVAGGELGLELEHALPGSPYRLVGERQQQRPDRLLGRALCPEYPVRGTRRGADADVLGHVQHPPAVHRLALVGSQLAGEDPQQRRLADPVGADQADMLPRRHAEGDVGEQQVAARVGVGEMGDGDVGHGQAALSAQANSGRRWSLRNTPSGSSSRRTSMNAWASGYRACSRSGVRKCSLPQCTRASNWARSASTARR